MNCAKYFCIMSVVALFCLHGSLGLSAELSTLDVTPPYLEIGTFYAGRQIRVHGSISSARNIIIEIKGPEEKSIFNVKGRVGPFWMSREKIELEHAPFLYVLLLPDQLKLDAHSSALGIGIEKLKQRLIVKPNPEELDMIFERFVKLKRSERLYLELNGAIRYSHGGSGKRSFEASLYLPSSMIPGEYKIVASVIHGGKTEQTYSRTFQVEEVGFIREVRDLAYHRELLYGILCVIIALFVGAIVGWFFKGAGAH